MSGRNIVKVQSTQINVNVTESVSAVKVTQAVVATVKIIAQGPQGAQGPPGDAAATYTHTQSSPSAVWTIAHNLGFKPSVELLNTGSQEIEGDVVHTSQNVTVAYFTVPVAGYARLT